MTSRGIVCSFRNIPLRLLNSPVKLYFSLQLFKVDLFPFNGFKYADLLALKQTEQTQRGRTDCFPMLPVVIAPRCHFCSSKTLQTKVEYELASPEWKRSYLIMNQIRKNVNISQSDTKRYLLKSAHSFFLLHHFKLMQLHLNNFC